MANGGYSVEQYVASGQYGNEQEQDYGEYDEAKPKLGNTLPVWGNARTMNINNLILTNIQASPYFKVKLYGLKTYHEVIDEIYYKIDNLEPWERGSRKTAGQTGMCGGVRGVGTGGIVSTSYCILFKLSTLKLTRKQLNGMLNHTDSPYIRGLGLMYIRYCQPPKDLYSWFEPYLDDEEEIDPKAGGGAMMTIGSMARTLLTKLEWFETLFPRVPVPIQKQIEEKLKARMMAQKWARSKNQAEEKEPVSQSDDRMPSRSRSRQAERSRHRSGSRSHDRKRKDSSQRRSRERDGSRRDESRDGDRSRHDESRDRDKSRHDESCDRDKSRHDESRDRDRSRHDDHKGSKRSRSRQERDGKQRSHSKSPGRNRKQRTKDKKQRSHSKSPGRSHKQRTKDKKRRSHSKSPGRSHKKRTKSRDHNKNRSRSRDREERRKERSH